MDVARLPQHGVYRKCTATERHDLKSGTKGDLSISIKPYCYLD